VFGTLVLVFLVLIVAAIVIGAVLAALPDAARQVLSGVISGTLVAPFLALVVTLGFYRLKAVDTTPRDW
jgi:high-affinity Fe2+/Pb2+ permease